MSSKSFQGKGVKVISYQSLSFNNLFCQFTDFVCDLCVTNDLYLILDVCLYNYGVCVCICVCVCVCLCACILVYVWLWLR